MIIAAKAALGGAEDAGAWFAIASNTVTTATTSITFSSIPQTYSDLVLVLNIEGNTSFGTQARMRINGNASASSYSSTTLTGNGASASAYRYPTGTAAYMEIMNGQTSTTANYTTSNLVQINNYANTSHFKTFLCRALNDKNGSGETDLVAGLFHSTLAVSQIEIFCASPTTFEPGSVVALYGIKKA
jgi:hypothetical protein